MTAVACAQTGCAGVIEDGYCTACGIAPVPGMPSKPSGATSASGPMASGSASVRGHLGMGLVEIPPVRVTDPASAVLKDPQVEERKRFCSNCGQPVGRSRPKFPGRTEGFCRTCGTRFSFEPKLQPGDLVAGQYEVLGCLAHGGLGWIYLARDRNVSDRWVVLKGLLNSGDADAQAAAVAERRFLAQVEHPSIVRIYNFVQHPDSQTGEQTGYIVMEYAGGQSLRQIRAELQCSGQALPVAHALAYAIEVLPALGYLHDRGLVYCDFKPENLIQVEGHVKLIDLGGVRRIDDDDSPIYGTVGYQAPEIATLGPSPSSDLYTVGRALAVLTFEFTGYQGSRQHQLPDQAAVKVLTEHESFFRLLRRATGPDPWRRFMTAAEMSDQLVGVLREVLCAGDGQARPALSSRFTAELAAIGADAAAGEKAVSWTPSPREVVAGLPVPLVDPADPAAAYLATLGALGPEHLEEALLSALAASAEAGGGIADGTEAHLALARARIATGNLAGAHIVLSRLAGRGIVDWRVTWHQGMAKLADGDLTRARELFEDVYDVLPGELAPKLALGLVAEAAGDNEAAARYLQIVWTTDNFYVSAAFGLARVRLAAGDRAGAVDVLGGVPQTSSRHVAAQLAAIRARISTPDPASLAANDLTDAASRLERLAVDDGMRHTLTVEVLRTALTRASAVGPGAGIQLLGCDLTEAGLRRGLERSYRSLARLAGTRRRRFALVDLANAIRPRTLI